jgi:DNA repair protein RecO (recombination protein O)
MRSVSTDGIVLNRQNRGEYDQSVTVFSPLLGKIRATAKGARKPGSRFAGHLEPLNICDFMLHRSARGFTIIQGQAKKTFKPVRDSLRKSLLSMLVLEIFQACTHSQEQGPELFKLISDTIESISTGKNHPLIVDGFKFKLMKLLGILPEIERCGSCRKRWSAVSEAALTQDSHLLCEKCLDGQRIKFRIPFNVIKLASYSCANAYPEISRIKASATEKNCFKKMADAFLHLYLDREIISERILGTF